MIAQLTPEELRLIKVSWENLSGLGLRLADEFYETLFADNPELRELFPENMTEQRIKFLNMMVDLISGIETFSALVQPLRELGARHATYGVTLSHYPLVGAALIKTVSQHLEFEDNAAEILSAWSTCYSIVTEMMTADL